MFAVGGFSMWSALWRKDLKYSLQSIPTLVSLQSAWRRFLANFASSLQSACRHYAFAFAAHKQTRQPCPLTNYTCAMIPRGSDALPPASPDSPQICHLMVGNTKISLFLKPIWQTVLHRPNSTTNFLVEKLQCPSMKWIKLHLILS